jgi:glyoxylase-like metal-dependent hydrolase (beta-lactamase superfamily II)
VELYHIEQLVLGDIATNCWVVQYGDAPSDAHTLVIDPGDQADLIIAQLERLSARPVLPAKLPPEYILLTHGHFDHIAALPDLHAAYPEAVIAIHREDAPYLGQGALELVDGDHIGPFTVLHTPGHTPGSAVFLFDKIMFSGDTLFRGDCGRVDLPGGDQGKIEESLKRLLALDGDIRVLPGHGEATTIAAERGTRFF